MLKTEKNTYLIMLKLGKFVKKVMIPVPVRYLTGTVPVLVFFCNTVNHEGWGKI
jgi:hypothetical protein